MSGGVAEWTDSCNVVGDMAFCNVHGGSFSEPTESSKCNTMAGAQRLSAFDVAIRLRSYGDFVLAGVLAPRKRP